MEALEDRRLLSAGALDTTFGSGGKVTTDFLGPSVDFATDVAVTQPDGKIVVVGGSSATVTSGWSLARYNSNGSLDTSFGSGGKVSPDVTAFTNAPSSVALQSDGKIVVAGLSFTNTASDFALARFNSDGSLDTNFGSGGKVTTDFGNTYDLANAVAIQTDGKIVVGGSSYQGSSFGYEFALARYNSDGSLDSGFGSGGKVLTDFGSFSVQENGSGLAIQSDGKIVAAGGMNGDFALARYTTNGNLDTSFGSGGKVLTDLGNTFDASRGVALQGDGKIVVAGQSFQPGNSSDFALARYNSDGSLDSGFGSGGKVTTDFGFTFDSASGVVIQTDGKIVTAGFSTFHSGTGSDFALARYTTSGSLDTGFGSGGKILTDFGNSGDDALGLALQADGRIVAAGQSFQPGTGADFALARYTTSGSLDTSFGAGGEVTTNITVGPSLDFGRGGVALQADGKLVVAGTTVNAGGQDFSLARYNGDGNLDTTFGSGGKVTTDFGSFEDVATSVAIQADGKIVVAGFTFQTGEAEDFALARYNTNGSLDTSFGSGGKVITDFGGGFDDAYSLTIQADGKIVVAGGSPHPVTGYDFTLARYNTDGSLDTGFGSGGKILTDFASQSDVALSVAIQADGKIVASGQAFEPQTTSQGTFYHDVFALARYNTDGSLDTGFGSGGKVTTDIGGLFSVAYSVAIQADGKIVAGGVSYSKQTANDFALARYNSDGSLDANFGQKGTVTTDFSKTYDVGFDLALQGDGKIVVAGETDQPDIGADFGLARYNGDGTLDKGFGDGGLAFTNFGLPSQAIGVVIQADGKIVAAGTAYQPGTGADIALARYIGVNAAIAPIQAIIADVQVLVALSILNNGQGNALLVKLQDAIEDLDSGQTKSAVNELHAFENEVSDFISKGILTSAQGKKLLDQVDAAIAALS